LCVVLPGENFAWFHREYFVYDPVRRWWKSESSGTTFTDDIAEDGKFYPNYVWDPMGTLVPTDKHYGRVAIFPFRRAPAGQIMVDGKEVELEEGWVFLPGLERLREQFTACLPSEHLIRSYCCRLMADFPTLPLAVYQHTALAYALDVGDMNKRWLGISLKESQLSLTRPPKELTRTRELLASAMPYDRIPVGILPEPYVESNVYPPEEEELRRETFFVTRAQGVTITDGQIRYNTIADKFPKTNLVAYQLRGRNKFVYCRASPNNQRAAFTRMYKCRGGTRESELVYASSQLALVESILGYNDSRICDLGNFCRTGSNYVFKKKMQPREIVRELRAPKVLGPLPVCRADAMQQIPSERPHTDLDPKGTTAAIADAARKVCRAYFGPSTFWYLLALFASVYGSSIALLGRLLYAAELVGLLVYDFMTFRYYYGHFPHDKLKLRRRIAEEWPGSLRMADPVMCRIIKAEVKDEACRPKKPPRLYFSLGLDAPMYGGECAAVAKEAMKGERVIDFGVFKAYLEFVDQNRPTDIKSVFNHVHKRLFSREPCVSFVFFSDDSFLVHNLWGVPVIWNLDISSCDTSNGFGVFYLVGCFMRSCGVPDEKMLGLLEQCTKPFRATNPDNRDEWFQAEFLSYYQISGTVLTTLINNWANLLVISAICAALLSGADRREVVEEFVAAAGYVVTIEECAEFEELTFLKRHPCRTRDGDWAAPICLGTMIRSFGVIQPQLDVNTVPNSAGWTMEKRARAFLGAVAACWVNEPDQPFIAALTTAFPSFHHVNLSTDQLKHSARKFKDFSELDIVSLCRRYHIFTSEYDALCAALTNSQIGDMVTLPVVDVILRQDYALA